MKQCGVVKGFKATNQDMVCRGYQFKLNTEHVIDTMYVKPCNSGFHFCKNIVDVFNYYDYGCRIFHVTGYGLLSKEDDKTVSTHIEFTKEIDYKKYFKSKNENLRFCSLINGNADINQFINFFDDLIDSDITVSNFSDYAKTMLYRSIHVELFTKYKNYKNFKNYNRFLKLISNSQLIDHIQKETDLLIDFKIIDQSFDVNYLNKYNHDCISEYLKIELVKQGYDLQCLSTSFKYNLALLQYKGHNIDYYINKIYRNIMNYDYTSLNFRLEIKSIIQYCIKNNNETTENYLKQIFDLEYKDVYVEFAKNNLFFNEMLELYKDPNINNNKRNKLFIGLTTFIDKGMYHDELIKLEDPRIDKIILSNDNYVDLIASRDHYDCRNILIKHGYIDDIKKTNPNFNVALCMAKFGMDLDTLINHDHWEIRTSVANYGYGLSKLIDDKNLAVRLCVLIKCGQYKKMHGKIGEYVRYGDMYIPTEKANMYLDHIYKLIKSKN